jgi:molybdate transport system permease protein
LLSLSPEETTTVLLSLKVALLATLLCLPIAIFVAHLLARKHFFGKSLLSAVVHLPLLLPPVVTGYVLLLAFGKRGFIGHFLDQAFDFTIAFRWTGAAVAAAIMALPLMVRAIRLSMEAVDTNIEDVASTLGASKWQIFRLITLPLAGPGVAAGLILTFVKALGEFGATITFVSNIPGETQTLSLAIYSLLQTPDGDAQALRLILISVALAFGAVLLSEQLERFLLKRNAPAA